MSASRSGVPPVLFGYFRSSCSWRLRAALDFKGIAYTNSPVNLLKYEHKQPTFLPHSPMGQVPALKFQDDAGCWQSLSQSLAVLEYLEESHPLPSLLPSDLLARARVREVCQMINSGIQPLQNPFLAAKIAKRYFPNDSEKQAEVKSDWAILVLSEGFKALEVALQTYGSGDKFCIGDQLTMADILLVPQVYNAQRFKLDMGLYPRIWQVYCNLTGLDCFVSSHPAKQPDCPPEVAAAA